MGQKPSDTRNIVYHAPRSKYAKLPTSSIEPIGIDTEAYDDGRLMMICTSLGHVFEPQEWPECMMSGVYRRKVFVAYNLKYDSGHFLRHLPPGKLDLLRVNGTVEYDGFTYKVIANKYVQISRGKQYIVIYDIYQYYHGSLEYNAQKYLGEGKDELETKTFSHEYVRNNWERIAKYCIRDCDLTARLAARLIKQLNSWGMHVRKLYSTAWVSYSWFAAKCGHPSVEAIWKYDRRILDYAMQSYNGGKFEVTTKGSGYLYEYDIVSAYPYTISNLLDLRHMDVIWSTKIQRDCPYAFIDATMSIPYDLPSPVAVKLYGLNIYPAGTIRKIITLAEYNYLTEYGADVTIHNAVWLRPQREVYPYRDEIRRLVAMKQEYKHGDPLAYHTVKIILNSLYGKFVQLVELPGGKWRAGSSWNPIYGSIITAETRVRIANLQRMHPSVWAVHTDSIISDQPLPYAKESQLGSLSYELEGQGILVGCGVYEIADKSAIRGVPSSVSLKELSERGGKTADVSSLQPLSWRMALMRNFEPYQINRWMEQLKSLRPDMDTKRLWLDDWKDWREVTERQVLSAPRVQF